MILKNLSFKVQSGEKVGVVGRTGAGKSSVAMAISRIVEAESGQIQYGGHKTSTVKLSHLRENITVISQESVLFKGTLRSNLDPHQAHSSQELIAVLNDAGLQSLIERSIKEASNDTHKQVKELSLQISEGGLNLSVGERQLVCIARACLRAKHSKLYVLDEATASIDVVAEQKVLNLLKNRLRDATVITIAHRLNTVMDSDKILVIDDGRAAEFGPPQALLQDKSSRFYQLV